MSENQSQLDLIDLVVEEILSRNRDGEKLSMQEYLDRYPELAEEIRDIFPALAIIEQAKPGPDDLKPNPSPVSSASLSTHHRIGDYRILRELGRGGMGVVYEAQQESLGRRVALKVLPLQMAEEDRSKSRFQREAQAAAQLHHANIVPVFEVGNDGEYFYYAMQLIVGQGLDRVVEDLRKIRRSEAPKQRSTEQTERIAHSFMTSRLRGTQPATPGLDEVTCLGAGEQQNETVARFTDDTQSATLPGGKDLSSSQGNRATFYKCVAEIGEQAASALTYAHQHGIIHRDVKPSNLMLDTIGTVWVVDFGLAKVDDSEMTQTGDMLGTLRYMSPERFQGQCDTRSDIYALGLTLYELVSLRPAFQSTDHLSLIDQIKNVDVSSLRVLDDQIPRDLETVILKCVEKDPKHRYQTAMDLEDDLRRFINDEPILARRLTTQERVSRWVKRNRKLTIALTTIFALLTSFLMVATYSAHHYSELAKQNSELASQKEVERAAADDAREAANQQKTIAEEQRDLAHSFRYGLQVERAFERAAVAAGDEAVGQVIHDWRTTTQRSDPRGWEWHYMNASHSIPNVTLPRHESGMRDICFSPSGHQVMTAGINDPARIWAWPSGELERELDVGEKILRTVWSPNEEYIAIGHYVPPNQTDPVAVVVSHVTDNKSYQFHADQAVRDMKWLSDSELFVHFADEESVTIAIPSMEVKLRHSVDIESADSAYWDLAWSVDHQFCAYASEKELVVYSRDGLVTARKTLDSIVELSWGQTADRLWTCDQKGRIEVWDVDDGFRALRSIETNMRQSQRPLRGPAFNATCDKIAFPMEGGEICVFDVAADRRLLEFSSADTQSSFLEWGPEGRWLAKCGEGINAQALIWNIEQMLQSGSCVPAKEQAWGTVDGKWQQAFLKKQIVWSRDGLKIATRGQDVVRIWDAGSLSNLQNISFNDRENGGWPPRDMQFSPDGKSLVTTSFTVDLIDVQSGQRKWRTDVYGDAELNRTRHLGGPLIVQHTIVTSAAWHPSGDRIAVSGFNKELLLLDANTGEHVSDSPFVEGNIDHVVAHGSFVNWTDAGLFWATADYGIGHWPRGQGPKIIPGVATNLYTRCHTSVSPDGGMLAFPGREGIVQLVDINAPSKPRQFVGHNARVSQLSWSYDGSRLATCDDDGILRIWDPENGVCVGLMPEIAGHAFDPIGPRLAVSDLDGNLKVLDASRSYEKECPPELLPVIERSLEAGSDRRYWLQKKAVALCRQWDWDAAASIYSDLSRDGCGEHVFSPGWWAIHEMHADRIAWSSLAKLPEKGLQDAFRWYAPMEPVNGYVSAHRNVPYLVNPVYCVTSQSLELAIDVGDAKAIWVNGTKIPNAPANFTYFRKQFEFHAGWNIVVAEFDSEQNLPPRAGCAVRVVQPNVPDVLP